MNGYRKSGADAARAVHRDVGTDASRTVHAKLPVGGRLADAPGRQARSVPPDRETPGVARSRHGAHGSARYATWRDLTAVARASFWGRATGRDGPGYGQGGSRARSRGSGDECGLQLNVSPRCYLQEVSCECR